jgi:hypothetical protein
MSTDIAGCLCRGSMREQVALHHACPICAHPNAMAICTCSCTCPSCLSAYSCSLLVCAPWAFCFFCWCILLCCHQCACFTAIHDQCVMQVQGTLLHESTYVCIHFGAWKECRAIQHDGGRWFWGGVIHFTSIVLGVSVIGKSWFQHVDALRKTMCHPAGTASPTAHVSCVPCQHHL